MGQIQQRELYEAHKDDLRVSRGFDMDEYHRMRELGKVHSIRLRQELEYEAYVKQIKRYYTELRKLTAAVGWKRRKPPDDDWLNSQARACAKIVNKAINAKTRLSDLQAELRALKRNRHEAIHRKKTTFGNAKVTPMILHKDRLELEGKLVQAKADIERLTTTINHLEGHREAGRSECPLCGSKLTIEETDKQLKDARLSLAFVPDPKVLNRKLQALTKISSLWSREKQKRLARVKEELASIEQFDAGDAVGRLESLKALQTHVRLNKPEPVEKPYVCLLYTSPSPRDS